MSFGSANLLKIDVNKFQMATDEQAMKVAYQPVINDRNDQRSYNCDTRADNSGAWNVCKAWYLSLAHLAACVLLLVCIEKGVNQQDFLTGQPPWIFTLPRYQAQVTGLISLSLVLIKILGSACSALLVSRTISVMLNQEGMTLVQLVHLENYRIPTRPRWASKNRLLWSSWAALVIILLWPSVFASPFVTSAVTWIPSTKLSLDHLEIPTNLRNESANWDFLLYAEQRFKIVISAVSMTEKDPAYAFSSKGKPFRRYFSSVQAIPANSTIDITVPYFDVDLNWINGADKTRFQHVGDSVYADVVSFGVDMRSDGSVAILRNETLNVTKAIPQAAEVFSENLIVSVKTNTLDIHEPLPDGSTPNKDTPCPTTSLSLGKLPNITQTEKHFFLSTTREWLGKDCYLVADASIRAGIYRGTNCTVNPAGKDIYTATCTAQESRDHIEVDWFSRASVFFMSEIMRCIVMLNTTSPWMHDNLDGYTTGMLHLAHHAAWSSLVEHQGNDKESANATLAESVIRARVDRTRMLIWLGMCGTLTLSAMLVAVGERVSSTKTVRDAALMALSMDLSEVAHSGRTSGLCNAVALSKEDRKLPRLKFANDHDGKEFDKCRRRLVFADEDEKR